MIKNLLGDDDDESPAGNTENQRIRKTREPAVIGLFDSVDDANHPADESYARPSRDEPFILSSSAPESYGETARRSGLAWSTGVVFFSAVVFMLILGWGADLLFGTSPWGIVAGIVLGSLIGFVQLFRLSSQIFKN